MIHGWPSFLLAPCFFSLSSCYNISEDSCPPQTVRTFCPLAPTLRCLGLFSTLCSSHRLFLSQASARLIPPERIPNRAIEPRVNLRSRSSLNCSPLTRKPSYLVCFYAPPLVVISVPRFALPSPFLTTYLSSHFSTSNSSHFPFGFESFDVGRSFSTVFVFSEKPRFSPCHLFFRTSPLIQQWSLFA